MCYIIVKTKPNMLLLVKIYKGREKENLIRPENVADSDNGQRPLDTINARIKNKLKSKFVHSFISFNSSNHFI